MMSNDSDNSSNPRENKPLTPILQWLIDEQANIKGNKLAKMAGIAPQTFSSVRQGKQDLSSDLLWRVMNAIAELRPNSDCAQVVALIRGQNFSRQKNSLSDVIAVAIDVADDAELEEAFKLFGQKIFQKFNVKDSRDSFAESEGHRVKSSVLS
jgi:transcriptional regulator with XRE-family HTH domain